MEVFILVLHKTNFFISFKERNVGEMKFTFCEKNDRKLAEEIFQEINIEYKNNNRNIITWIFNQIFL